MGQHPRSPTMRKPAVSAESIHSAEDELEALVENERAPKKPDGKLEVDIESQEEAAANLKKEFGKLLFGAGGIYAAFLYYGSLQEDVFRFEAPDGTRFKSAWFLQCLEAIANVILGLAGRIIVGGTPGLPKSSFWVSGAAQVSAKAFKTLSMAYGLSYPVATLAKSGKMAPVMMGQLLLGGATYTKREYAQVAAVVLGTAMLSLGKKGESHSTVFGLTLVTMSLAMDGLTAGVQKRLKEQMKLAGKSPQPYDFMLFTNLSMMVVAFVVSCLWDNDFLKGVAYCVHNPEIFKLMVAFSVCSAVGQSFIFYTVAHFDPLVCTTVTTTRKIFSVLFSIVFKGHSVSPKGWLGVGIAISGLLSEMFAKIAKSRELKSRQ